MKKICVIDYGSGNIKSVYNAVKKTLVGIKGDILVTSEKKKINESSHIILPGVGSFKACIEGLQRINVLDTIKKKVFENCCPFLGICVGMQMLSTVSYEKGTHKGLNWIPGKVKKLKASDKNFISILKNKTKIENSLSAYFVHSYVFILENNSNLVLSTEHGQSITAMISKDNIFGTQFHPEKSHTFVLIFLETFFEIK